LISVFLLTAAPAETQVPRSSNFAAVPDTQEARTRFLTSVVTANWNSAVRFPTTVVSTAAGQVQISVDRQPDFFFVRFLRERDGGFPLVSPGNTIVKRNFQRNGDLIQAKIFLSHDPSSYLRLYPQAERTRADVILYGAVVRQALPLPMIFYTQLRDHLSRILATSSRIFDWGVLFREPAAPSAATSFGQALETGRIAPGSPAARLLGGLGYEDTLERFLEGSGRVLGSTEFTSVPMHLFADDRDPRVTAAFRPFPRYEPGKGLPVQAVAAAVHAGSLGSPDDIFAAFFQAGTAVRRIILVPAFDTAGVFSIRAYEPAVQGFVSWPEIVSVNRDIPVRLARIPAPQP
ncbi:MAG TPA: hypothetical protein VLH39_08450, partial [Magnetospirillaceae bacterium]|nr:hypothetical protein [Magnetospirillaceae bacterium]